MHVIFLAPHFPAGQRRFVKGLKNVGARVDFRYFHSFNPLEVLGLDVQENKLDFSRFSGGVVFRF